jgi:predicted transglutaminase-like cysteine proteinase
MTGSGKTVLFVAIMAMLASANIAMPAQNRLRAMITGNITSQPIGHYEFCKIYKAECNIRSKLEPAPKITAYGWEVIRKINSTVNTTIVPMTDEELYGREEVWAYPTTAGDCEDFVLLKQKLLMEKGFDAQDLLITVVRKPDGEGHAVLTLRTSEGDYILDNLDNQVKLWTDTPYTYLKRQAAFNSGRWVTIENSDEILVGALK